MAERITTFEKAFPPLCELSKRLIPLKTACESIGVSLPKFQAWLDNHPAKKTELAMIRAESMIEAQDRIMLGKAGWQATARVLESLDPELWLKKSATAFGRKVSDVSPYAEMMGKK